MTDRGNYMETPIRDAAYYTSPSFKVPNAVSVLLGMWVSTSVESSKLQVGPAASSTDRSQATIDISCPTGPGSNTKYRSVTFGLSQQNSRVCIYDNQDSIFGPMFYIYKVAVLYAQ